MKTNYFLIFIFTLFLGSCDQLNSDNWQWEKPADWRLPLLSNYSTVILNYLPTDKLNIIGNTVAGMPEENAKAILTAGLKKLPPNFDTIFSTSVRDQLSAFRNNALTSSTKIGNLVNSMISEVEKQEKYPQVLKDFIDVIDEIVTQIGGTSDNNIDKIIDDLNNTKIERSVADVDANLGSLLGAENIESLASGTLLLDIIENTIPLSMEYAVEIKFSDGTSIQNTISLTQNKSITNTEIRLTGTQIKNLESFSGSLRGTIDGIDKNNLALLMTGKLVTNVRVKLGTDKVLIKF